MASPKRSLLATTREAPFRRLRLGQWVGYVDAWLPVGMFEDREADREIDVNGVRIIGVSNMPGRVAAHASEMYSSNVRNLVSHFWDSEKKAFNLDLEDEILQGCVITHAGEIVNAAIKELYA